MPISAKRESLFISERSNVSRSRKAIVQSLALTGGFLAGLQGHTEAAQASAADRTVIADWPYVNHDTYGTRYSALSAPATAWRWGPYLAAHELPSPRSGAPLMLACSYLSRSPATCV